MKLRVSIENKVYDVGVEVLDSSPTPPSLVPPVITAEPKPEKSAAALTPVQAPAPKTRPKPPPLPKPVDVLCPLEGSIVSIHVKVGDAVLNNDDLLQLEASKMVSPGERPMIGSVRSEVTGTVLDVLVKKGDAVKGHQPLIRIG
ncbi:MAG: biotin/lipoyl-containing protein [Planctomycetota bacterium]|nr:biotin/lipoyl-containing protein [Planctomycetota bacterium]